MNLAKEIAIRYAKKGKPTIFDSGIGARLPQEYRKFYDEWRNTAPEPVHYIPREGKQWERNEETWEIKRYENVPLPETFSKELHEVFTGGESIIQGFKKKKGRSHRVPKFWVPITYRSVIYSEVLDKYMSVIMTKRAVELIHKNKGLDNYLLQSKACDLKTLIALKLKREILLSLRDKKLPYNEEKKKSIIAKYEKYLPSSEEIEWYGLSFTEACKKLENIEKANQEASIVPLKHLYRAQFIVQLKSGSINKNEKEEPVTEKSTWFSKIPGINKLRKAS